MKPLFRTALWSLLSATAATAQPEALELTPSAWFAVLELPFLFVAVFFAFLTARALRGGIFGRGMAYMAWGFLVMGIGHLHMQVEHFTGFNLFSGFFGETGGQVVWVVALLCTWTLSGYGFYMIYKASRGG